MSYYFPTFLTLPYQTASDTNRIEFAVDSGKSALRLLLRSFKLPAGSKIAIPAFVCSAVREAVEAENLIPVYFDLDEKSFWTAYDFQQIESEKIRAVILVHLYGFMHPHTKRVSEFCKKNNILLIHDAAQSYGIDENALSEGDGIVYSFGPGKSVTAAGGGWISSIDPSFFSAHVQPARLLANKRSELFLKSRTLNYRFSASDKLYRILCSVFPGRKNGITRMSSFAKKINTYAVSQLKNARKTRLQNYKLLAEKISGNKKLSIVYDDTKGQYFKLVMLAHDAETFREHLRTHKVPFFSLFTKEETTAYNLPNFSKYGSCFIELSTEACLPQTEMERVGNVLASYRK
jgi:dTDP-4-amino-4,6-dideoxygalactose transaminase